MDKELYDYLLSLKLTKNEIEDLCNLSPSLCDTSYSDAKSIINILNFYNYPKSELAELVCANPNILALDSKKLASALSGLVARGLDIEEYLKQTPSFAV